MEKDNGQWVTYQTGVQFYMQEQEREDVFTDIQVAEDVTTVSFGANANRKHLYHLKHIEKRFPNVTTLVVHDNTKNLDIPNTMFPNVKKVKPVGLNYVTGPMLIRYQARKYDSTYKKVLLNAFEQNEEAVLDLQGVEEIADEALQGCKAKAVLHTDWLRRIPEHALDGSYFESIPYVRGCKFFGTFLVDIDETAEEVWIPDNMSNESPSVCKKLKQVKKLVVQSLSRPIQFLFAAAMRAQSIPDTLFIQTPERQPDTTNFTFLKEVKIKYVQILESKAYSSKDGLLFDATGETLLRCPSGRTGTVYIPEGTKRIACAAFGSCVYLEKVVCPQSLRNIGMLAFSRCSGLKEAILNQGLEEIGDEAFFACSSMQRLQFPGSIRKLGNSMCEDCLSLSEVVLEEGIRCIETNMFRDCENLKTLVLPNSIQEVGPNSMLGITELYLKKDDAPDGLAGAVCYTRSRLVLAGDNAPYVSIYTPSGTTYIPKHIQAKWARIFNKRPMVKDGYQYASCKSDAIRTAFAFYQETNDQEAKAFIRRKSLLAIQFLSSKELVRYMQAGLLSNAALKKLQEEVAKNPGETPELQAYLLEIQKKKSRNPKQKFAL